MSFCNNRLLVEVDFKVQKCKYSALKIITNTNSNLVPNPYMLARIWNHLREDIKAIKTVKFYEKLSFFIKNL